MQELEKILEEIELEKKRVSLSPDCSNEHAATETILLEKIEKIIRKHMNDDWVSVEERLPEEKINPISRDFYEYQVTAKFGNAKDVRYYRYGNGHWWNGPGIVDKYVIAWRENPEPYRQGQPETCKYTNGSCCWPIDQCGDCPKNQGMKDEERK